MQRTVYNYPPNQARRLKRLVETLKSASWRGTDPELATSHGSSYSSGSSSDMLSTTDATLSVTSSDPNHATSLQSLPQEANGHGDGGQRPLRERDRINYSFQKYQQHNMLANVPSYINPDVLAKAQQYLQGITNNDNKLGYYQNQSPSRNILEKNDSLQNRNVADLRNQQTVAKKNGYHVQNQSVFPNQNPSASTNQNTPQQGYSTEDPRLSFSNPGAVRNQAPLSTGNQMLSRSVRNSPLQKKSPRTYRNVNPASIRKQWSASRPKPSNSIRMCLVQESDKNRTKRHASSRLRILNAIHH